MPPMRCCSRASRCRTRAGSARPRSSSARKARTSGLRVLVGKRQAIVSSSDRSPKMLAELVERTLAMASAVPEDPFCGLADPGEIARDWPSLDMLDPEEPSAEQLIERARAAEEAALAVEGVTNSEGAEAGWGRSRIALAASNGFAGGYAGSSVRGQRLGDRRLRHPDGARLRFRQRRLRRRSARSGRNRQERRRAHGQAARARARCRPAAFRSCSIRGSRAASSRTCLGAISGPSIARGTSFLKDKLGQRIFPEAITITEDPHRRRGHRSKPFDAEGLPNRRRALIDKGVLTTWLLDLRSARQLGLTFDRACRARHRLAARPLRDQHLDRARSHDRGRADGRHQERLLSSPS